MNTRVPHRFPAHRAVSGATLVLLLLGNAALADEQASASGLSEQEMAVSTPEPKGDAEPATTQETAAPANLADQKPLDISWDDLLPEGEMDRLEEMYRSFYESGSGPQSILEGGPGDTMEQIGTFNTVGELDATKVRIPGYMVPLDFSKDRELSRFLLVPYFGACLHTPPPPPNQIVFVTADPAVRLDSLWEPVSVEGVLRTTSAYTDTGNAAYTLTLSKLAPYEY